MAVGVVGLTGTIFLQYFAFDLGNILEANVIAYAWPLFVAVWAAWLLRNMQGWVGLILAGIGFVCVLLIFDAQGDLRLSSGNEIGYLVAIASALCMAFYTVVSARIHVQGDQLLIPAAVVGALIAFTPSSMQDMAWPPLHAWWTAAYIGVGPMAAGFFLWTFAMSGDGAKTLAPIGYATPLLSTMLLLSSGEGFTSRTLVGAAMVLVCSLGVLATERIWR